MADENPYSNMGSSETHMPSLSKERYKQMHAYASVDFSGTQRYEEHVFYNNHRFKKPGQDEAPSPRSKVVERYSHPAVSPPPFAKDL